MYRYPPQRIVCLSEETVETLYLLGEADRIVGISGFVVRPPQARREKPRVSGFTTARMDRILALQPDLVLGFSDLQADLLAELMRQGITVVGFNHRSLKGILSMIETLGALVGVPDRARGLVADLIRGMEQVRRQAQALPRRPRIYFEEWEDPMISGIRWVSELVELAGGEDIFPELRSRPLARDRIVSPQEVIRRRPDIFIASWCGRKFRPERVRARPGWEAVPAVQHNHLYEIKSCNILQPGPAALTDGLQQLHRIITRWAVGR